MPEDELITKAKVKELVQKNNCNAGSDIYLVIGKKVAAMIKEGCNRAQENARKTLRGIDL
jgi:hypothetical protein